MNQSQEINELVKALALAQAELQPAIKDSINPFFKSKYADLGSVWDVCRPVLSKNGLCIMQTTEIQDEKTILSTMLAHTSGQWVKSHLPLNPSKNDSQGMGAAITYLRRYSLSALVGVVCDDEDDGETAVGRGPKQNVPVQKIEPVMSSCEIQPKLSSQELQFLSAEFAKTDDIFKANYMKFMQEKWGVTSINDLPSSAYKPSMTSICNNIKMNKDKGK